MNHGKIDKQKPQTALDKWNNALARMLGKREKKSSDGNNQTPTSDGKFGFIVIAMVVFLWLLTGIYYVPQNTYGIIMHNGKVSSVKSGIAIGIDYPYPFSDIAVIDNISNSLSIGKVDNEKFVVVSANDKPLQMVVEVVYRVTNPRQYFIAHYQENTDFKQIMKWQVQSLIQSYVINKQSSELLSGSSIVIANDIRRQSEFQLANFGIKVEKMTIVKLSNLDTQLQQDKESSISSSSTINSSVGEILNQAKQYQNYINNDLESQVKEFHKLLPEYRSNPDVVAQLMYYKMLSSIPVSESAVPDFSLLRSSLDEFKSRISNGSISTLQSNSFEESDIRKLNRTVDREREFKGR
ncbi:SPFH domain-containing protein [Aquella oligotrophica]|uniref:Band 7 domain-containing protein n=1 Tax=Aquella oligotrophica TaxID=2067065 RepID=A0A2I7N5J4_9NEIS|nr:SPFH domain-containing protein [Aquella oligotrophica]AUR51737.1 hypothetical protein CUN60_05315 [Aquella oligotrophica]